MSTYVKLQIWTRRDGDGEEWTVYKLPDGTEYRGDVYGHVDEGPDLPQFDGTDRAD